MVDTIDSIDVTSLVYKDLRKNSVNGGISVPVMNGSERFAFQLSFGLHDKLQAVWNVSQPQGQGDPTRCNLDLKFMPQNDTLKGFLKRIDESILKESCNHEEWFATFNMRGAFDIETLRGMYKPLVQVNEKYNYEAIRVKVVLPSEKNKYPTEILVVIDEDVEEGKTVLKYRKGDYTDLKRGAECIVTVDTQGLWFAKLLNNYGLSLNATTILTWPPKNESSSSKGVSNFKLGDTVLVLNESDDMVDDFSV